MKKITIALLCILINLCVLSQVIKKSGNHIHFKISEVKLADSLLSESGKLDVIENHNSPTADRALINESLNNEIERALSTLTAREKEILKSYRRHQIH